MTVLSDLPANPWRGFFCLLKGAGAYFFFIFLFKGITVAAEMTINLTLKYFFDALFTHSSQLSFVLTIAVIIMTAAVIQGLFSFLSGRGAARIALSIAHTLRTSLFNHIQQLSFSFHDKAKTGELIQKSGSDVESVQTVYSEHMMNIVRFLFLILFNFTAIFLLSRTLALFSVLMVPVLAALSIIFFRIISRAFNKLQEQEGVITHSLQEYLASVRVVKAFARQKFEEEKFDEQNRKKYLFGKKWRWYFSLFWPASHLLCVIQTIVAVGISGYMTYKNQISIGTFIAYNALLNDVIWPMQHLGKLISQLSMGYVSYKRIAVVLNEKKEDTATGIVKQQLAGDIEFRSVAFAFREDVPVLQDISFACPAGSIIGIIGETGSGKSVLMSLLPRFYEAAGGEILVDNVPVSCYAKQFLRRQIGIVEQSPFLFAATVEENIACGSTECVLHDDIVKAAQMAAVHDEILQFPGGYGTLVGEKGITLSGGQRQRIVLARTLVKNPSVLILDDFASSVDSETEMRITDNLVGNWENRGKRTLFIITHRIRSLVHARLILVMKGGKIIQQGTHETLARETGMYKRMYDYQVSIEKELKREVEEARGVR